MVFRKRKRQIEYCGEIFYWFVRKNENNLPRIHILSEDKRINLEYPLIDTEEYSQKKTCPENLVVATRFICVRR